MGVVWIHYESSCCTNLVDSDRLAVELDHVQHLNGVVSILLPHELNEAIALVGLGHPVLGHVRVHWEEMTFIKPLNNTA